MMMIDDDDHVTGWSYVMDCLGFGSFLIGYSSFKLNVEPEEFLLSQPLWDFSFTKKRILQQIWKFDKNNIIITQIYMAPFIAPFILQS